MKIAFVTSLYAPDGVGGAERTVQTLAEALVARGHQACVISLAPGGRETQGEIHGVRTRSLPLANLYWPFAGAPRSGPARAAWAAIDAWNPLMGARLGRILDEERPDLLQTGNLLGFSVAAWQAAARRGIPVVQMLHDYYLACPNSSMFRQGRNCETQCGVCHAFCAPRRLLSDLPAAVISLSRRLLERVEAAGMFAQVPRREVIHGASNFEIREAVRFRRQPVRPGVLTLGYLGRIEPTKGLEFLLEAVERVRRQRPLRVLLGGRGAEAYVAALRERHRDADVEFLGFVKPQRFFERVDLLAVPSLWEEPLGRVIYEAYAHGLPSIVTRVGGMPEIVEDGRTGFIVEPGDVDGLAALLDRLAGDWQPGDFSAACLDKSRAFRVERLLDRYLSVWQQAAGAARSGVPAAVPLRDERSRV